MRKKTVIVYPRGSTLGKHTAVFVGFFAGGVLFGFGYYLLCANAGPLLRSFKGAEGFIFVANAVFWIGLPKQVERSRGWQ